MKKVNLNPITKPEDLYDAIVTSYKATKLNTGLSATVSNETWMGRGVLFYLESGNVVLLTDVYYKDKVQYDLSYDFEKSWGQLLFLQIDQNSYQLSFEILQGKELILKNGADSFYQKTTNHVWVQSENTQMKMLTIYLNDDYLTNKWGLEISNYALKEPLTNFQIYTNTNLEIMPNSETEVLLTKIFEDKGDDQSEKIKVDVQKLIEITLIGFLSENMKFKGRDKGLEEARLALLQDFINPPDLSTLSKIAGMNKVKFQKSFKEEYGDNFYQYFQKQRFDYAKRLIEMLNYTVSEAAYTIGYKSVSHFGEKFFKYHGIKPGELKTSTK